MRVAETPDRRGVKPVGVERETDRADPFDNLTEPRLRNSGQDEVLPPGETDVAADVAGDSRKLAHLPPAHQAEAHREAGVAASRRLLLVDAHVLAFARGQRPRGQVLHRVAEAFFDQLAKSLRAVIVNHELEPRLDAGD